MGVLYHFSHFLELLAGLYFGGFALFTFMEKSLIYNFYSKIDKREERSNGSRILIREYFKSKLRTPDEGLLKFFLIFLLWSFIYIIIKSIDVYLSFAHIEIKKNASIENAEHPDLLIRKYFPAFFFSGCFCLTIIPLSAIQYEHCNSNSCYLAINKFLIFYLISALIYYAWALLVFPRLVNKYDYIKLICSNVIICIILFGLSIYLSTEFYFSNMIAYLLFEQNEMILISLFLFVFTIPLIFVLLNAILVVVTWVLYSFAYSIIDKVIKNVADNVVDHFDE